MNRICVSVVFSVVCILAASSCFCGRTPSKTDSDAIRKPASYAAISAGTILAKGKAEKEYGRSNRVDIVELWRYRDGDSDYRKVVTEKFGKGVQSVVSLPQTPYHLIMLGGTIQPLILDSSSWVLWQIHGLGPHFPKARGIIPDDRRVTFRGVEGFADFDLIWKFDFSDPEAGFIVEYDSDWGW